MKFILSTGRVFLDRVCGQMEMNETHDGIHFEFESVLTSSFITFVDAVTEVDEPFPCQARMNRANVVGPNTGL
jgi:hypothetical protein